MKAYYIAFSLNQPASADQPNQGIPSKVSSITNGNINAFNSGKKYDGEKGLLLFQNIHRYAMYFAVIFIFIENLIRIISGYPLIHLYGFSTWDKFHYFWWHTGQYALIMSLFVLWVMIVAGNPRNKSLKKNLVR